MNIISLGAGVQSTTMLLMAMHGEIEPMPDCAIFADTGWEPKAVYEHLAWLESVSTIPIKRVTKGNLRDDSLATANGGGTGFVTIPLHTVSPDGRTALKPRQCTNQYKLQPLMRGIRELNGQKPTTSWIGISLDEAHRMKDARVKYITHRWPLIEKRMTRSDCIAWMERNGYPKPPRSACIGCPFRNGHDWRLVREDSEMWADAVEFDRAIRNLPHIAGSAYLHWTYTPLEDVDMRTEQEKGQLDLWGGECQGMCGL